MTTQRGGRRKAEPTRSSDILWGSLHTLLIAVCAIPFVDMDGGWRKWAFLAVMLINLLVAIRYLYRATGSYKPKQRPPAGGQ